MDFEKLIAQGRGKAKCHVSLSRRSLPSLRQSGPQAKRHQQTDRAGKAATFYVRRRTKARLEPVADGRKLAGAVVQRISPRGGGSLQTCWPHEPQPKLNCAKAILPHIRMFANSALAEICHCVPALLAVTQRLDTLHARGLGHANGQICRDDKKTAGPGRGRQGTRSG